VHALGAALLALAALPALAGTFTALAPQTYTRDTGSPVEKHYGFAIKNPSVPYRLRVENGAGSTDAKMTASAIIKINGVTIFGTNDFNAAKSNVLEAPVTVSRTNDLSIELRSEPGSAITLRLLGEDNDRPLISSLVVPAANAAGWIARAATVTFTCSDQTTEISQCSDPVTLSNDGAQQTVTGTAIDGAGNSATTTVTVNIDHTGPAITFVNPPEIVSTTSLTITGTVTDALSGASAVTCNGIAATLSGGSFQCSATLSAGVNVVDVYASDVAGNTTRKTLAVSLDQAPPLIRISQPAEGITVPNATVTVIGAVTDDDRIASVKIGGTLAALDGNVFSGPAQLAEGNNTITVTAFDRSGNQSTAQLHVTRFSVPSVAITAPSDQAVVAAPAVTISGTVSDPAAAVRVNGIAAVVSGATWRADGVMLQQGRTVVTATATNAAGHQASATVFIYRDSVPPRLTVYSPADGTTVYAPSIDVTGMVDDIVVGTINAGQARITVNGTAAEVSNRAFLARNVPLNPGANSIIVVATDQGGNTTTATTHVTYDAAARAKIVKISGDNQSGGIASTLPAPLVVRLVDSAGAPAANRAVTFEVIENNGSLTGGQATARVVTMNTNAQGDASVVWHLGTRAGAGNNRVLARAAGFAGTAEFEATAASGTPSLIVIDAGSNQIGALGSVLPRPLIAAVVDSGSNRIAGVPVTFAVLEGDATLAGAQRVTVNTDSDGRAWVTPALGTTRDNTFTASIDGAAQPAVFVATGKPAGPPGQTRISGVVLDNEGLPIAGVSMRIEGTTLAVQTNDQGQFTIAAAPVGYVKLIADGSTAQRSGTWPMLEYAVYTIAGQNNTLEMPVYLLPIDVRRGIFVDETTGGTLTIPELPGFALTIAPGSATFPGGSRTGTVSATLVHADKVPMAPGFGQQPRFIVTIQPPGVHFDPPASLTIPNADGLAPGEITELYSFDHDLGQFVAIGTGAVSEDGTVIRSDPGVGIIKGGWHCGGNPSTTGATAKCPECKKCNGSSCVTDVVKQSKPCKDDGDPGTEDVCENGTCLHKPITVHIGGSTSQEQNYYADRDDPSHTLNDAVALAAGKEVYSNPTAGDLVAWRVAVDNQSMKSHIAQVIWTATGPETHSGPASTEWLVSNLDWKPGTYEIKAVVKFDNGAQKTATYQQKVGIRTNDYILYGSILAFSPPVAGVDPNTIDKWECPEGAARLVTATLTNLDFNHPVAPTIDASVPENWPDRLYVNYRILNMTANTLPIPTLLDQPRYVSVPGPPNPAVTYAFGASPAAHYRQAVHAQFKYLVENGKVVWPPSRIGDIYSISGYTPAPCSNGLLIGAFGAYGPRNDVIEPYADGTGFGYIMQIRAGTEGQTGYDKLNRRNLPYVYFRLRFDATGSDLKTVMNQPASTSPDGPDDHDFSPMPTFTAFRRFYSGGTWQVEALGGFPVYQNLEKFLALSPKDGSGGPYYP
jgi:hypothetical protein